MPGEGKTKLIAYIERVQSKLKAVEDSGEAPEEDEVRTIVSSVVNSIKGLSAGAPGNVRSAIRDALDASGCLENGGPNPAAGTAELSAGVAAVAELLGVQEEGGEPAQEDAPPPHEVDVEPGDETETLVGVVKRLWEIEQPCRLVLGSDIELNMQRRAELPHDDGGSVADRAREPLFKHVNTSKFSALDKAFVALLDNYNRDSTEQERVTRFEKQETARFMDLLGHSPHMQYVHKVLLKWELVPASFNDFMAKVYDAWFTNYYGSTSSGFEHVFVGEEKKDSIIGLHNWMQFFREEQKRNINYLGYAHKGPEDGLMISVTFTWKDDDPEVELKPISTFVVGSSIAFDFALATLVFFGGKDGDKPWVSIGGHDCAIQLYKMRNRMGTFVRTVYIE